MPEDNKKNQHKGKNDPKEQRRKRQGRQNAPSVEKKPEKEPEKPKMPEKPAYEPPPPEFYKNLKRETDEIIKITEEANTKYKKKEIQSNWAKYEMLIDSYEEIDEQENLGADYEALIQAPLSIGGHFQFKHEKSWDVTTGPTPYDKYFEINMDNLALALTTIPFYERNSIDLAIFNENDIQSMNHRATKCKQKYYVGKDLKLNKSEIISASDNNELASEDAKDIERTCEERRTDDNEKESELKEISFEACEPVSEVPSQTVIKVPKPIADTADYINNDEIKQTNATIKSIENKNLDAKLDSDFDDVVKDITDKKNIKPPLITEVVEPKKEVVTLEEKEPAKVSTCPVKEPPAQNPVIESPCPVKETPAKNPVIESPEDLEKWLDDFLDG